MLSSVSGKHNSVSFVLVSRFYKREDHFKLQALEGLLVEGERGSKSEVSSKPLRDVTTVQRAAPEVRM